MFNITNIDSKYYTNSQWTSGAYGEKGSGILLSTGASETFSKQGIYDIAGNVWEWTLEYTSDSSYPCAYRGGIYSNYGTAHPAVYRSSCDTTGYSDGFGFRGSLY